ncbi:hypothetical protein COCHEDRAFT_1089020 [Bipolaris maydis C5]|uniref:Mid2 domain-containing protein n=2 Tax=Cochliobolus heterostrophus TaxID=5016 RepID=M2V762_COCH5|nr:hypothetical protein COCHEDRAFT_1089020 [Bipolaris maydis C5]KAJ5030330.1 hypothetical protein J3E73DRAFT_276163 [Bipolaris maydis]KAJ6213609.1 hypothetical protein PSV09DRAFT_1089020 [Bipolaris maydis]KAJ6274828.1 hypothetical protein PSV08DRAFT_267477 [Bipolaris maydis]KAJ6285889.1 hypothetical protein J3E71DRAFT_258842 [Bipolaris maydis]
MHLFTMPSAMLGLAAFAYLPAALAKPYPPLHFQDLENYHNSSQSVEKRACDGVPCGYDGWLCCPSGSTCYTDAQNQAQCGGAGNANPQATGGVWEYRTTTYVETVGLLTKTQVFSTYVPATATQTCSDSQNPCGSTCCDSGFYCLTAGQCALIAGGSTGGISPSAPLRPTGSGVVIVTYTGTPTATVPFQTPIPTGAAGNDLVPTEGQDKGLSGGAIAGIVIGVILGVLLLLLLCLFCCARALFDTLLAIFGFGKKRKHSHEETYIEEHHHSGGAAGGRWYGAGRPARPSRAGSEKHSGAKKGLGIAAGLGGLALALGLKRHQDHKADDKSTTISGTSYMYSDYTSTSSASSSDRHTRRTRHSSRR